MVMVRIVVLSDSAGGPLGGSWTMLDIPWSDKQGRDDQRWMERYEGLR
jgi:hypothetical protein